MITYESALRAVVALQRRWKQITKEYSEEIQIIAEYIAQEKEKEKE